MDEKDLKIVEMLIENARIPKTHIAKALNVTETAIRKRIQKLERMGVIIGYRAVVNYKAINMTCSLTGIDIEPERMWMVVRKLKEIKEIKSMWLTTGDHTLILEIVTKGVEELSKIHEEIEKLEGVKRVCPSIVLDVLK